MKLTPLDIRHKEFRRGMRGYADVEVDEFLDEVADEYERLFKENIDLNERVEALEDKVSQYKRIEETLQVLKDRITFVLVTNNTKQAARVGDRVAFFLLGEMVEDGPADRLFMAPTDARTNDYLSGRFG